LQKKQTTLNTNRKIPQKSHIKNLISIISILAVISLILSTFSIVVPGVSAAENNTITVNTNSIITNNVLQLGFQLDGSDIEAFRSSSTLREYAKTAGLKIVRFFPQRLSSGDPCTSWPSRWNWAPMDDLISKIEAIGAKPMPVLGFCGSSGWTSPPNVPKTSNDFAEYCREWVKHYGNRITIYEIINEPHHGFTKGAFTAQEFMNIYNKAATAMKQENPNILVGNDNSMITWSQGGVRNFEEYFAQNVQNNNIDFLSWHRYITGSRSESDASLISKSEYNEGCTYGSSTMLDTARQLYKNEGHGLLPVIQSEGNLNYAFGSGTDPRIQQMINAVSHALSFKLLAQKGYVNYNIYFNYAGSGRSSTKFGMINLDNNSPYPAYYVHWMLGNSLSVGDKIVESTNTNTVSSLAWIHNGNLKIMLINKNTQTNTVTLSGINGPLTIQRLDQNRNGVTTETTSTNQITLNGYTVLLVSKQGTEVTTPPTSSQPSTESPETKTTSSRSGASISAPSQAYVGSTVTFDGSDSYLSDGYIRYYRWEFGDGNREYGETVYHSYNQAGTYTVTLTIIGSNYDRISTTQEITIENKYSTTSSYSSTRYWRRR